MKLHWHCRIKHHHATGRGLLAALTAATLKQEDYDVRSTAPACIAQLAGKQNPLQIARSVVQYSKVVVFSKVTNNMPRAPPVIVTH